jgi:tripartite-type tricarboxylate transporter receptor subunit TctC
MKTTRRQFLHLATSAATVPAVSHITWAQSYPSRPITIVVPFPAGGGTDAVARTIADGMRTSLGQTVIIENLAGANGSVGVGRVARARGDGYTIGMGEWGSFVANGAVYALPYNLLTDFSPISLVTTQPLVIVAKKTVPANDLQGLVAWLIDNPDKALAGTSGIGGIQHVGGVYFQNKTGTRLAFIPYRGGAPALQDLLAGQIDLVVSPAADCIGLVRAGTIKAFAGQEPIGGCAEYPERQRGGLPRAGIFAMVCVLCAEGYTSGSDHQAQYRGRSCVGRFDGTTKTRRSRPGRSTARAANTRGARWIPKV